MSRVSVHPPPHILQWTLAEDRAAVYHPLSMLHWMPEVIKPDILQRKPAEILVLVFRYAHCYLPGSMASRAHCNMFGGRYTATRVSGSFFWSMWGYIATQASTSFLWSMPRLLDLLC